MTLHVALLRGINVGGHKAVAMADLRDLLALLGFEDVRSLLASGNLLFRSRAHTPAQLERMLVAAAWQQLGLRADFFVRSAQAWHALVAGNPFPREAEADPSHHVVMLFARAPSPQRVRALASAVTGPERVSVRGRHAYAIYPNGIARSHLTSSLIEGTLGVRVTARNWNTVLKLAAACAQDAT